MSAITSDASTTIANGTSLSPAVYLGAKTLRAIQMPAAWTAAALSFQGSVDGVTYNDIYDSQGVEWTVAAGAARYIPIIDGQFSLGILWLKIRSGLTAAAVNQGADRILKVLTRRP